VQYRIKNIDPNSNSIIYNNITPLQYSEYAEEVTKDSTIGDIFTVFAFDPIYFFRMVANQMKEDDPDKYSKIDIEENYKLRDFLKLNENEFWSYLNSKYPHFQKFEELKNTKRITITRLLIKKGKYWEKRNMDFLELYMKLGLSDEERISKTTSNITCYIIDEKHLRADNYLLSDHVTYTSNQNALLATYDIDAKTLLITYEKATSMSDKLINHFKQKKNDKNIYHEISSYLNDNNPKYKSHLFREYYLISELPTIREIIDKQVEIILEQKPKSMLSIGIGHGDELNLMLTKLQDKNFSFDKIVGIDLNENAGVHLDRFNVEKVLGKNLMDYSELSKFDCVQCSFVIHDIKEEDKKSAFKKISEMVEDGGTLIISEMLIKNQFFHNDNNKDLRRKNQIDKMYIKIIDEVKDTIKSKPKKDQSKYTPLIDKLREIKEDARQIKRDFFIDEEQIKAHLEELNFVVAPPYKSKLNGYFAVINARKKS